MERVSKLVSSGEVRDSGRINVLTALGIGFLAWYGLNKIDDLRADGEVVPTPVTSVDSTGSIGLSDGRITPSTLLSVDQAILDAIDAHHATTVSIESEADTDVTALPETTHETHETTQATTVIAVDTTHPHIPEDAAADAVVTQTATTVAHNTHTPPQTPVAQQPSPNTTHGANHVPVAPLPTLSPTPETTHSVNHTSVVPVDTQPTTLAPVTINSTAPPLLTVPVPAG